MEAAEVSPTPPHLSVSLESIIRPLGAAKAGLTFIDHRGRPSSVPYDELGRRAGAAGAALAQVEVAPGDSVAMVIGNDLDSVTAALGTWAAGATLVSLPPPPSRAGEVYSQGFVPVLKAIGCRTIVGTPSLAAVLGDGFRLLDPGSLGSEGGRDPERSVAGPALIQFTSGSVGAPKGVVLSASTLAGHVEALGRVSGLDGKSDRGVNWVPLYHDMGFVASFLYLLAGRAPLTIMNPASVVLNPRSWLQTCAQSGATMTAGSDFAFRLVARAARATPGSIGDLSALRACITGGERVSWTTLQEFHAAASPAGLRWEAITPGYGLAEATAALTLTPIGRGPAQAPDGSVSSGRPLPGVEVKVAGTISIRGPWMLDSYVTGEGYTPAVDAHGWFKTNDLGHLHDGELHVLGRADEVVTTGGQNHFGEDVEAVALNATRASPVGIAAFVAPGDDSRFGLAVEVTDLDAGEAFAFGRSLQGSIATALGIRVSPVLVLRPWTIPRTTSGKVKRPQCRELLAGDRWPPRKVLAVVP